MTLITKAPPSAPLDLTAAAQIIQDAAAPGTPNILTISAASGHQLSLLDITAIGHIQPNQPGTLTLMLYGQANIPDGPDPTIDPASWTLMATTPPEPIGGATDPAVTQWMIQGTRMMYFLESGKMQGESLSNIASHPVPAADLETPLTGLVPHLDPVAMFAIGALFTPDVPPIGAAPVCTMTSFTLSGD
jgi:hypothetical protein